jgi:8-oxo-dGTP diphosphatase
MVLVVAAALMDAEGRVLLAQRPANKSLGGLWEFPGGKVEPGEAPEAALVRELAEELAIHVDACDLEPLTFVSWAYPDFHLLMPLWAVRRWRGEPRSVEAQALAWAWPSQMDRYPMPPADGPLVNWLQRHLAPA